MNIFQLIILWLAGIAVSSIFSTTGMKLLAHAAAKEEIWQTGYPFTLMVGTVWTYVVPIVIMGIILVYTLKDIKKKIK